MWVLFPFGYEGRIFTLAAAAERYTWWPLSGFLPQCLSGRSDSSTSLFWQSIIQQGRGRISNLDTKDYDCSLVRTNIPLWSQSGIIMAGNKPGDRRLMPKDADLEKKMQLKHQRQTHIFDVLQLPQRLLISLFWSIKFQWIQILFFDIKGSTRSKPEKNPVNPMPSERTKWSCTQTMTCC